MNNYVKFGVRLSDDQLANIRRAFENKSSVTIQLGKDDLNGPHELMLTQSQISRIQKAAAARKGLRITLTKTQLQRGYQQGGFAFLPFLAAAAAPALGAVTGKLTNDYIIPAVTKLFKKGRGSTGGKVVTVNIPVERIAHWAQEAGKNVKKYLPGFVFRADGLYLPGTYGGATVAIDIPTEYYANAWKAIKATAQQQAQNIANTAVTGYKKAKRAIHQATADGIMMPGSAGGTIKKKPARSLTFPRVIPIEAYDIE